MLGGDLCQTLFVGAALNLDRLQSQLARQSFQTGRLFQTGGFGAQQAHALCVLADFTLDLADLGAFAGRCGLDDIDRHHHCRETDNRHQLDHAHATHTPVKQTL